MIDVRQLQQFVAVAETLNFHKAADQLCMSQPPLSATIRQMELELGFALFVRESRGISLTPAGRTFLHETRNTLQHYEVLKLLGTQIRSGTAGILRIGFVGSATYQVLPHMIHQFNLNRPGVKLELFELTTSEILRQLESHELDIGAIRTPCPIPSSISLKTLQFDELVLAMPKDHRLASQTHVRLADLADDPFIFYSARCVPAVNQMGRLLCSHAGFHPRIVLEANQSHTIVGMVAAQLGVALVPSQTRRLSIDNVVYRPLDMAGKAASSIQLSWAWLSEHANPAVDKLLEIEPPAEWGARDSGETARSLRRVS